MRVIKGERRSHVTPSWSRILAYNGIESFTDLWAMRKAWFEPPNERRGGWSGVSRIVLRKPGGGTLPLFLKIQENHTFHPWYSPWKKELTFLREYHNLRRFAKSGIPAPELVYFGEIMDAGNRRAILLTRELTGYRSLQELMEQWEEKGWPPAAERRQITACLAQAVRKLHKHRWFHQCLYPKHIFVRIDGEDVDVRFIDLEKARQKPLRRIGMIGDLGPLYRRSKVCPLRERILFFREYFNVQFLGQREKKIWAALSR